MAAAWRRHGGAAAAVRRHGGAAAAVRHGGGMAAAVRRLARQWQSSTSVLFSSAKHYRAEVYSNSGNVQCQRRLRLPYVIRSEPE